MNVLITVTWRAGASHTENRAAAQVVQERLMNPFPGVTIVHTPWPISGNASYTSSPMSPSTP